LVVTSATRFTCFPVTAGVLKPDAENVLDGRIVGLSSDNSKEPWVRSLMNDTKRGALLEGMDVLVTTTVIQAGVSLDTRFVTAFDVRKNSSRAWNVFVTNMLCAAAQIYLTNITNHEAEYQLSARIRVRPGVEDTRHMFIGADNKRKPAASDSHTYSMLVHVDHTLRNMTGM
jgi:hypothetical protein